MAYTGTEKRKSERIPCHYLTSYRLLEGAGVTDTSQLKNMGSGGILVTTSEPLASGALCALKIRVPFARNPLSPIGRVIESHEVVKGLIYDTRLSFADVTEDDSKVINEVVGCYLRKTAATCMQGVLPA
jgi:hypothetical protein